MGWFVIIENCGFFVLDLIFREVFVIEVVIVRWNKENNVKRGIILVRKLMYNFIVSVDYVWKI